MKTTFLILFALLLNTDLSAATYTSIKDGDFFDSTVWDINQVPTLEKGDSFIIAHHLIFDLPIDTLGLNSLLYFDILETGILCFERDYYYFNIIMHNKGLMYSKYSHYIGCEITISGVHYQSGGFVVSISGFYRTDSTGYSKGTDKETCPELEVDSNNYNAKCPKLTFSYDKKQINDTTDKITFWNSQSVIMKIRYNDSNYLFSSGDYIIINHKLSDEIDFDIEATDICDRPRNHSFKLTYKEEITNSSIHTVKENNLFSLQNRSNSIWNIKAHNVSNYYYQFYDIVGRNIESGVFRNNLDLDLRNQSNGMYFIQLSNTENQHLKTYKIVVEN